MIHSFARHMMLGLAVAVLTMTWVRAQPEDLPESRPFLMGMSPFPYDLTQQAQDYTYDQLAQHTDLILHHMDTGIPWDEALTGQPYHPAVQENIAQRVEQNHGGEPISQAWLRRVTELLASLRQLKWKYTSGVTGRGRAEPAAA